MRIANAALCALLGATLGLPAPAGALSVHVQRRPTVRANVNLHFTAPALPEGGYYYAVVVLRPYRRYTRHAPPPCSSSSNMERTDYGYPKGASVSLALTPAKSATHHWCRGGSYEGAIYAVPHAPPCESTYPCRSEPYKPPSPCWNIEGKPVCGVVVRPKLWSYPDRLPAPVASGTRIVGHFSVSFPAG